jgi:hypothetical protein
MSDFEKVANSLGITIEEAKALMEEDREVDKMTSNAEAESDLSEDQKEVSKGARRSERKPNLSSWGKETKSRRKEKPEQKAMIDSFLRAVVEEHNAENIEIINDQASFTFFVNGKKYKIVLSCPRS